MKKQNHINFITVVLFFGVIATLMIYFGISALLQTESGDRLNAAIYESDRLGEIIDNLNFKLFKEVDDDNVIVGSDRFLFERTNGENGYSYLRDYRGEASFSPAELELMRQSIEERRTAYENGGAEYLLVVIPNSITVYSENMPFHYGKLSENTRLSQLSEYLSESETDCFFNATDTLISAKNKGQLYNNTENSLNALGAYTLYISLLEQIAKISGTEAIGAVPVPDFHSRLDIGKETAQKAGLQNLALNLTISMSSPPTTLYREGADYQSLGITKMSDALSELGIMLEYNDDWFRVILEPYFSNTFASVAYKQNLMFSEFANSKSAPSIVIQLIYEYELESLLDEKTALTYGAGTKSEGTLLRTPRPTILGSAHMDADSVCIFGMAEKRSELTLKTSDGRIISQSVPSGQFFIRVDIPEELDSVKVDISAKNGIKKASSPVSLMVVRDENAPTANVEIGKNSELFAAKYPIDLVSDPEELKSKICKDPYIVRLQQITEKPTEYVQVIVPSKLTVRADDAPSYLMPTVQKLSELRRAAMGLEEFGVCVIDATAALCEKDRFDMYCLTGDIPTALGAYEIYRTVAAALGFFVPEGEPSLSSSIILGGKFISALGLDPTVFSELSESCEAPSDSVELTFYGKADLAQKYRAKNKNASLPTAIIIHDEYGTEAARYLCECFGEVIVYAESDFRIDAEDLAELKPDYVIKIVGENNMLTQ